MAYKKTGPQRQRRIQGGRIPCGAGFDPKVWAAVKREAHRFNVSIPFVMSLSAQFALGIDVEDEDNYRRPTLLRGANG